MKEFKNKKQKTKNKTSFLRKSLKFYGDDITLVNFKWYKFKNICIT